MPLAPSWMCLQNLVTYRLLLQPVLTNPAIAAAQHAGQQPGRGAQQTEIFAQWQVGPLLTPLACMAHRVLHV